MRRIRPEGRSAATLVALLALAAARQAGAQAATASAPAEPVTTQPGASPEVPIPTGSSANATLDEAVGPPATLPPAELRLEMHLGQRLMSQGLPARAVEHFRAVVQSAPQHPGAWFLLSRALSGAGQLTEAVDAAQHAVDLRAALPPERAKAFSASLFDLGLGLAQEATARLEEAEVTLRRAESESPDNPTVLLELGALQVRRGEDAEAKPRLLRAVELDPGQPGAHLQLATALLHLQDLQGAQHELEAVVAAAPDLPEAHYLLASVFRAMGDAARQQSELATFESLRSKADAEKQRHQAVDAQIREATAALADGKDADAARGLEAVLKDPLVASEGYFRVRVLTDLAHARDHLGDAATAEGLYARVLEGEPGAFTASFELGTLLARQGRVDEALPHLVDAVEANPFDPAAHVNLALAWSLAGRLNEALAELEKASVLDPQDPATRQLVVDLHWAVGHHDRAVALAEAGGVKDPSKPRDEAAKASPGAAGWKP